MHWIDWCILIIPLTAVLWIAVYSKRYVRGVADYLAAGRVAGRYVLAVGDLEASLGIFTIIALAESRYQTGYGLLFWEFVTQPVMIIIALTGFCVYRFRETKALSLGQFLEMRYSRKFRIIASFLRSTADILGNAIGPAVAANFFIYFFGFPHWITIAGFAVPTFALVVAGVLTLAMIVLWSGGRVSLLITDFLQGLVCLPIFAVLTIFILYYFSWDNEIAPVLMDRVKGESFLNPFDISKLRDFNILLIFVLIFNRILNRGSWIGNDTSSCARTPHEQKMAGILGTWRSRFQNLLGYLLALTAIVYMAHTNFADNAKVIRDELAVKVAEKTSPNENMKKELIKKIVAIPVQHHQIGNDKPLSRKDNLDTVYMNAAREIYGDSPEGNLSFQKYKTAYQQMLVPLTVRRTLPVGLVGVFCLLMVMLMISTDDSRIMNCSSTFIQDVVMPFKKKPLTPKQHLLWLRLGGLGIALIFFMFSLCFVQVDFVQMIITAMLGIWLGGAGPVMLFGMYSRFGNTFGAYMSLLFGSGISITGAVLQNTWAEHGYPFCEKMGWVNGMDGFLKYVSSPFNPYIEWKMDAVKFPINSYEIFMVAMVSGLVAYVIGSLVTYRKPYNLDRLLHRGKYSIDGEKKIEIRWTFKNIFSKLIGITPEYSKGDKAIAWLVFLFSFGYQIGLCFLLVLAWNIFSPWPVTWWSEYFYIVCVITPAIMAAGTAVWFTIGGIRDAKKLFKDLASRVDNPLDDGRVEGHVSLMDKELFSKAHINDLDDEDTGN